MAGTTSRAPLAVRAIVAAIIVCTGWLLLVRATSYQPLVSDLMFVLPALVAIATGRGVAAGTRMAWVVSAIGAALLVHLAGVALDLRVWPSTPVGPGRMYAGVAYESLSWSLSPVVVVLFVRAFPGAFGRQGR